MTNNNPYQRTRGEDLLIMALIRGASHQYKREDIPLKNVTPKKPKKLKLSFEEHNNDK